MGLYRRDRRTAGLTFVGGDSTFTGGGTAASVNGEDIPAVEFQRVLQDRMVARQQETRSQLSPEVEEQLKRETLDGLVLNRAVIQFVRESGFRVSCTACRRPHSQPAEFPGRRAVFQAGL